MSNDIFTSRDQAKPMVSICCATFNQASYIEKTLEGFLKQEVDFPIEVLVHDDVSTDGTRELVQRYATAHPDIITAVLPDENQYSKGVNVLAKLRAAARGKYIALCEGDDYWVDPRKLSLQVAALEADPDVVMTGHRVVAVDQKGNELRYYTSRNPFNKRPLERDFSADELRALKRVIPTSCRVFRNIRFDLPPEAKRTIAGDAFLQALLANYGTYKFVSELEPSYYLISDSGTWSRQSKDFEMLQRLNAWTQMRSFLEREGHFDASSSLAYRQTALMVEVLIWRSLRMLGIDGAVRRTARLLVRRH